MQRSRVVTTFMLGMAWFATASAAAWADHGGRAQSAVTAATAVEPRGDETAVFPVFAGLGPRRITVTTASAKAQAYFDQGLAWAYGFNHWAAAQAFRAAQAADPACAMCYWGEAYVLGPNINDVMHDEAIQPAFRAAAVARALSAGAGAKERALIEALAQRYRAEPEADRAVLDQAYAEAMRAVAKTYPDDVEVQVLFAEALMDLQPWDYWQADKTTPRGHGAEIVAVLERALRLEPEHPHAIHLYIHAVEASATPERAEPHADRLVGQMPGSGHMVHMPSHIYLRVGRYQDSYSANEAAALADEAYIARVRVQDGDIYTYGYYPHNIHFMVVSAQMSGAKDQALAAADRLLGALSDPVVEAVPIVQAIATAPFAAYAQLAEPEAILALPDPGPRFPLVRAFRHYARGIAHLGQGALDAARQEQQAIDEMRNRVDLTPLVEGMVPGPELFRIASLVLAGRIARAEGRMEAAVTALEEAVRLQDAIPYMEPSYWYYPVRQTLAATHLMQGDAARAETLFRASLEETPESAWALFGLLNCQLKQGKSAEAAKTRARFEAVWQGESGPLTLERL